MKKLIAVLIFGAVLAIAPLTALENFSTPQSLSGFNGVNPAIAVDSAGNVEVVWAEISGTSGFINAAHKTVNGNWTFETIAPITSPSINFMPLPDVVLDNFGNGYAIWADRQPSNHWQIKVAQRVGGTWQLLNPLTSSTASSPAAPVTQLAVDPFGNVQAAFQLFVSGTSSVFAAQKLQSQSQFGVTTQLSAPLINSGNDTHVATDFQGNALAVWSNQPGSVLAKEKSLVMPDWASAVPETVFTGNSNLFSQVGFDPLGNAIVAWVKQFPPPSIVFAAIKPAGSFTWGAPQSVFPTAFPASVNIFNMNVDAHGNTSIISTIFNTIQVNTLPNGKSWGTPQIVTQSNLGLISPNITVDANGNATAIWILFDFVNHLQTMQTAQKLVNQDNWSTPEDLKTSSLTGSMSPFIPTNSLQIVSDPFGNVTAVWTQQIGTNLQIWTATKISILPPSQLIVKRKKNDFGTMYEYYNRLEWSASTSTDVTGYIIYRDGVQIAQVGSDELRYKDHNRKEHETVTYGVATVDTNGLISVPTTVTFVR